MKYVQVPLKLILPSTLINTVVTPSKFFMFVDSIYKHIGVIVSPTEVYSVCDLSNDEVYQLYLEHLLQ